MTVLSALRARLPRPAPSGVPSGPPRPREAFVLSGGGSLGAVQVGALRALLEAGIVPDLLVGCSVGALNAAFLAQDPSLARLDELERLWRGLDRASVFGGRRLTTSLLSAAVRREDHLYEPDPLRELVRRWVPLDDLSATVVPCQVVTTDLLTGEPCYWGAGDPVAVLTASACLPAVFPPVSLGGGLHVDGGVTCPVPVARALDLGAVRTWVVDVSGGVLGRSDERMNALDVLLLSFAITRSRLDAGDGDPRPDQRVVRVPRVAVGRHELRDFTKTAQLLQAGYAAGRAAVDAERAAVPAQRTGR